MAELEMNDRSLQVPSPNIASDTMDTSININNNATTQQLYNNNQRKKQLKTQLYHPTQKLVLKMQ
jgi:hypothetical protein